ncbi:Pyridoxamine 5'-phosphate oxidase putative domain-containing protein OS=Streptomyces antimycoticus OX=68175 GN=SSPO_085620 PE=4 SV=1 [Streptomyces antimycoticus]
MENTAAPAAAVLPPRPQPRQPRRYRRPTPWLGLVAIGYAVVQLAMVIPHTGHALGWDESVYVSQVDPRTPPAYFSAPRSRGVSLLVAPVVAATDSIPALRLLLMLVSAGALYGAFRVWTRLLPPAQVALAALLFSGLWITQISGPAVMPNLWVAIGAVAAVGWFLRAPHETNARWWLAAVLAGVTLVRTPDGGWLTLPLLIGAIGVRTWRPALPALIGGPLLGAAQWIGEAYDRFGGIGERLNISSDVEGGMGLHFSVGAALRSLNGPQLCRPCEVPLRHPELTVWWLALPVLTLLCVHAALRDRQELRRMRVGLGRPAARLPAVPLTVLPIVCAATLALPYLLLIDYSAPRFLMPSYALLALPIAGLVFRAVRAARSPQHLAVALGVVITLHLASQFVILNHTAKQSDNTTGRYRTAAQGLQRLGLRPPCLVTGDRAQPVAYHAGCSSAQTSGNNRSTTLPTLLRRAAREPTALLLRRGQDPAAVLRPDLGRLSAAGHRVERVSATGSGAGVGSREIPTGDVRKRPEHGRRVDDLPDHQLGRIRGGRARLRRLRPGPLRPLPPPCAGHPAPGRLPAGDPARSHLPLRRVVAGHDARLAQDAGPAPRALRRPRGERDGVGGQRGDGKGHRRAAGRVPDGAALSFGADGD